MTALPNSRTTKGGWKAQRDASGPFAESHVPLLNEFIALSGLAQASLKLAAGVPCVEHDRIRPRLDHAYVPDAELHKLTDAALRGVILKPVFDALLTFAGNHYRLEDLIKLHEAQAVSLAAEEEANERAILAATEELYNRLIRRTSYLQKYLGEEASIAMAQDIQDTINEVKSSTEGLVNVDCVSVTPARNGDEDEGGKATNGDDDEQDRKRRKTT
ncbi:hypothetical protein JCM10049v2_006582 [Rhodotorula toruloides]